MNSLYLQVMLNAAYLILDALCIYLLSICMIWLFKKMHIYIAQDRNYSEERIEKIERIWSKILRIYTKPIRLLESE